MLLDEAWQLLCAVSAGAPDPTRTPKTLDVHHFWPIFGLKSTKTPAKRR